MSLGSVVVRAIWVMLPAYLPNNIAVLVGGGKPIDSGRKWCGKRILGDGKTWRGTIGGIMAGILLGLFQNQMHNLLDVSLIQLPKLPLIVTITLPTGAMLGDIVASFIKRLLGKDRGESFLLIDQLDFVIGSLLFTGIIVPNWFGKIFTFEILLTVVIITPLLHLSTNLIAYLLNLKQEPY
ncbi:MAG: CDP-2,3-bis-(O-geranylgeranyl)-sn-glycerol synthase [Halobacteriaceae archaeon]